MTVAYVYTDGLMTKLTADLEGTTNDQDTVYVYGTTNGGGTGESEIATGHLLQEIKYPDTSGASDTVTIAYNAQSQETWREDQSGNVIEIAYDSGGRVTDRKATTVDADFDGAVKRITTAYDSLGRRSTVTQYDAASAGNVVDEVKFTYDGWGNLEKFEQDRNGTVGESGSIDDYEVSYVYAKEQDVGRNTIRRTSATLPSGNVITYDYATSGLDDDVSRVSVLKDGAARIVTYGYLGVGHVVQTYYDQPDVKWYLDEDGSGDYPDLDRFNRVTTSKWTTDLATDQNFYDIDITYDRNSGITLIEDNVHAGFDVSYTNDDINRLTSAQEGTWGGSSISSETRHQEWTLDHLGNWDAGKLDLNGDGDWTDTDEYNDDRGHNKVNELETRDVDDDGTDDYTLTYDEVGNLTDDGETYEYVWDVFGRLRKVWNQGKTTLLAEFKYNGLGYRISVHEDNVAPAGVTAADKWFHYAYDERWRQVATFREDDSDPKEEFLPHQAGLDGSGGSSYIDLVVYRDRDANTAWTSASDGTLEEKVYFCQNWRADVSAIVAINGDLVEWVKYSAYGVPFGMPGGDTDSDGDCDSTDITQVQTWINSSAYDVRADVDLDGDVDSRDKSDLQASYEGETLGWEALSWVGSTRGYAGAETDARVQAHVRHRVLSCGLGRWLRRDPIGYWGGTSNLFEYARSTPHSSIDPSGLRPCREFGKFEAAIYDGSEPEIIVGILGFRISVTNDVITQLVRAISQVCFVPCLARLESSCEGGTCLHSLDCDLVGVCSGSIGVSVGVALGGTLALSGEIGYEVTVEESSSVQIYEDCPEDGQACGGEFTAKTQVIFTAPTGSVSVSPTTTTRYFSVTEDCCCPPGTFPKTTDEWTPARPRDSGQVWKD